MSYTSKYLGKSGSSYEGLDPIPSKRTGPVTMRSDEVTAKCPQTNQPDFYTVEIDYMPDVFICESKSLKLFFTALRDEGIFCEDLADQIADEFVEYIKPKWVTVMVEQKPRGGISIVASAARGKVHE